MLTNIHKKLSQKNLNFYDYAVGVLIGAGAATGSIIPIPFIIALMVLSFKGTPNDTNSRG